LKKDLDKNHKAKNSRMAENFEEVKELGKQMEHLRTNTELKEDNKVPDPIQGKETAGQLDHGATISSRINKANEV